MQSKNSIPIVDAMVGMQTLYVCHLEHKHWMRIEVRITIKCYIHCEYGGRAIPPINTYFSIAEN